MEFDPPVINEALEVIEENHKKPEEIKEANNVEAEIASQTVAMVPKKLNLMKKAYSTKDQMLAYAGKKNPFGKNSV